MIKNGFGLYIIISELNKFYVGNCINLNERLEEHRTKKYEDSFTTLAEDWELFLAMNELEGTIARKIENHIKAMKSKIYIQNLKKYPEMQSKLILKFSV